MVPSPRTRNATGREEERMASNGQPRRRCAPTTSQAPANITSPPLTKARSSWGGPAHPGALQPLANNLAARFRRTAADVPSPGAIRRIVRAVAVVLEVADQFPQLLAHLGPRAFGQLQITQIAQQRLAALVVQNRLGLLSPLLGCRGITRVPDGGKIVHMLRRVIPVQNARQVV